MFYLCVKINDSSNRHKMTHKSEIIKLIIDKFFLLNTNIFSHIEGSADNTFIICQGSSPTQVDAIADSVREYVQEHCGAKPYNYDGYQNSQWIVIDYGDVFVHIFLPDVREHYNLEELWSDAPITEIPDLD